MLKDEMARARRKIDETERKAEQIEKRKVDREMTFVMKREEAAKKQSELNVLAKDRLGVKDELRERRYQMYLAKR